MNKWLCMVAVLVLVGCGDSADSEPENENQQTDPVETLGVTQQCEYLGNMYSCDGDFAAWDVFMTSCEAYIPENCTADDQALLSGLFTCLDASGVMQSCNDDDYAACESTHSLSGLSAACDEVIAL